MIMGVKKVSDGESSESCTTPGGIGMIDDRCSSLEEILKKSGEREIDFGKFGKKYGCGIVNEVDSSCEKCVEFQKQKNP